MPKPKVVLLAVLQGRHFLGVRSLAILRRIRAGRRLPRYLPSSVDPADPCQSNQVQLPFFAASRRVRAAGVGGDAIAVDAAAQHGDVADTCDSPVAAPAVAAAATAALLATRKERVSLVSRVNADGCKGGRGSGCSWW